jgi:hypothetical protein
MSHERIQLVQLRDNVLWVIEDGEGTPMCIGEAQPTLVAACEALARARAIAREDNLYRRDVSGFLLLDDSGVILGRSTVLPGVRAIEAAIATTRRALLAAPLFIDGRLESAPHAAAR